MVNLAQEGMTMIVVTHEMGFARKAADRVVFMADGQIVEEATPEEFFTKAKSERAKGSFWLSSIRLRFRVFRTRSFCAWPITRSASTWAKLLARAQADADAAAELDWLVAADSTTVRVHQHGATARRVGGNAATVSDPDQEGDRQPWARTDN